MKFYRNGEAIACGVKQNNAVYRIFFRVTVPRHEEVNVAAVGMKTWHERLGHINVRAVKDITSNELVDGVIVKESEDFFCDSCQFGKSHKLLFKMEIERNMEPGEMVHSDVCGPIKETLLGEARFFFTFKDDATGYRHVYFMKHEADVFERFVTYEREICNKFGRSLRILRSDNGREYVNDKMKSYMQFSCCLCLSLSVLASRSVLFKTHV